MLTYFLKGLYICAFICAPLFAIATSPSTPPQHTPKKRPNILFIIADDWGKHAKSYGTGDWINMPTFDKVAEEGILLTIVLHQIQSAPHAGQA